MESKRIELHNRVEWQNELGRNHRVDGPAVEWNNGDKEWWVNGLRHREDGHAIEYPDGGKWWYLNGKQYPEEMWKEEVIKLKLNRIKGL